MLFVLENVITPLLSSFFTVLGGTMPIAILVFLFSLKEKERLMLHANEIEKSLPIQEQLLKRFAELIEKSITPQNIDKSLDHFKQYVELQNMLEEHKKFIKYARNYNFISAVAHILRVSNYMPKSMDEHKDIAKNLPGSRTGDT